MATTPPAEAVAGEIRAEAARQRITWRSLAETTDIKRSTLARRMADPSTLSYDELSSICAALHIAPSDLMARAQTAGAS
jgi:DNA-binding Xre family transcriptional regulator